MIQKHPLYDDWLGDYPSPSVPASVRRRRLIRRALLIAAILAAGPAIIWAAPYAGAVLFALMARV